MKRNNLFTRQVYLHIVLWVIVFFAVMFFELGDKSFSINTQFLFLYFNGFFGFILTSYFHILFLIPKFFKKKKYFLHFGLLFITLVAVSFLSLMVRNLFDDAVFMDAKHQETLPFLLHMFSGNAMLVLATSFIFFVGEWMKYQDMTIKLKEAENEKTFAELNALKAQLNPHFLFNTLNNLYALALEKSNSTPEMILKLSDLMSYILYECKSEKVLIQHELEFIQNYIELEKQRFGDKVQVEFGIKGENQFITISPLLFIPFIENAFKYGANVNTQNTQISIAFKIEERSISFEIKNSIETEYLEASKNRGGVGIENVKKRLALLYPQQHELKIGIENNWYTVTLKLFLNGD